MQRLSCACGLEWIAPTSSRGVKSAYVIKPEERNMRQVSYWLFALAVIGLTQWPLLGQTKKDVPKGVYEGPTIPKDLGPTIPKDLGPTIPKDLIPTTPKDLGPTIPKDLGPTIPKDWVPTTPKDL